MKLLTVLFKLAPIAGSVLAMPQEPSGSPTGPAPSESTASPVPVFEDYPVYSSPVGNCSCGYTYCGFILQQLYSFTAEDLVNGYVASGLVPTVSPEQALHGLFLCRGDDGGQEYSSKIQLLAGCAGDCYNIPPDFRAHCSKPCAAPA